MARVTDDERRRVAERLRTAKGPSLMVLMEVLGVGGRHVFARLADLIEPVDHIGDSDKMVDRDALLALAEGLCDGYPYGLSHGGLEQLARRIRKACGEVVA